MTTSVAGWRNATLWLVIGIPSATLIGGFLTLALAIQSASDDAAPERVQHTAQTQTRDLSPDIEALRRQLIATIEFSSGSSDVHVTLSGQSKNTLSPLHLNFVHPLHANKDFDLTLQAQGNAWFGSARLPDKGLWHLVLHDAGNTWRLVGQFDASKHQTLLRPALAAP